MIRILFQGDSITDAGRFRDNDNMNGCGYPTLVAAQLGYESPGKYTFINRGVSDSRSIDVYARIKSDIINHKPDVLSILIGVNDVGHEINYNNGISDEKFEKIYDMMIKEIKEALPDIKIIILEPFVLKNLSNEGQQYIFRSEVEKRAEAARRVAQKNNLSFIPLMKAFDDAAQSSASEYWLFDGVHPTAAGHEIIKKKWIEEFKKLGL